MLSHSAARQPPVGHPDRAGRRREVAAGGRGAASESRGPAGPAGSSSWLCCASVALVRPRSRPPSDCRSPQEPIRSSPVRRTWQMRRRCRAGQRRAPGRRHVVVDGLRRSTTRSADPGHLARAAASGGEQQYPVPLLAGARRNARSTSDLLSRSTRCGCWSTGRGAPTRRSRSRAETPTTIAEITRRLDGLPLALEIVAPWLRLLTPADLATTLSQPLDMPGRRADAPARHRTLRDTIPWSYDMLPPRSSRCCAGSRSSPGASPSRPSRASAARRRLPAASRHRESVRPRRPQPRPRRGAVGGQSRFRLLRPFVTSRVDATAASRSDRRTRCGRARPLVRAMGSAARRAQRGSGVGPSGWRSGRRGRQPPGRDRPVRAAVGPSSWLQLVVDAMTLWFEAGHEEEGIERLADALARPGPDAPGSSDRADVLGMAACAPQPTEAAARGRRGPFPRAADGGPPSRPSRCRRWAGPWPTPRPRRRRAEAVFDAADRSEGVTSGTARPRRTPSAAAHPTTCGGLAVPLRAAALAWQQDALRRAELEGDRRITAVNAARLAVCPPARRRHRVGPANARPFAGPGSQGHRAVGGHRHLRGGPARDHEGGFDDAEQHLAQVFRSASRPGGPCTRCWVPQR